MTDNEREVAVVAQVVANAWRDEAYRAALLADPAAVLADAGLNLGDGVDVTVLADTDEVRHLAVPRDLDDFDAFAADIAALLPLADGVELRVHQSTESNRFLVLPAAPQRDDQLSDEELTVVIGGGNGGVGGNGGNGGLFSGNGGNGGAGGAGLF